MIDHHQAKGIAAERKARLASYAGGKSRHTVWVTLNDDTVDVRLYQTIIAHFTPGYVEVFTGGFNTVSTVEALNATVGESGAFSVKNFVLRYRGEAMTEGMKIAYDGTVIEHTGDPTPQRRPRG